MAEPKVVVPAKKVTRKKAGFRRVVVELTEAHYEALEKLAVADLRNGGATEMATVLLRLNLDTLIKNHRPAQAPIQFGETGFKESRDTGRDYIREMKEAAKQEAVSIRPPEVTFAGK